MSRFILWNSIVIIIGCLTFSFAYSSQSFNFLGAKSSSSQKKDSPPSISVVSPQQFQSNVQELDKKTQDELRTQVKNSLSAPPLSNNPSIKVTVPPHTTKEDTNQPLSAGNASGPNTSVAPGTTTAPPPPQTTQPATESAPAAAPLQQSQPYTGFGPGDGSGSSGSAGNSGSGKSGGWNIKY